MPIVTKFKGIPRYGIIDYEESTVMWLRGKEIGKLDTERLYPHDGLPEKYIAGDCPEYFFTGPTYHMHKDKITILTEKVTRLANLHK